MAGLAVRGGTQKPGFFREVKPDFSNYKVTIQELGLVSKDIILVSWLISRK